MSSGRDSFGSISLHIGPDWGVQCHTYENTTPILTVNAGRCGVSLSIAERTSIPAEAVAFARELARQAAAFAAECDRLNATNGPAAGDEAA